MTGIDSWAIVPATNATADGGSVNWAENQVPSSVNNTARQMCADVRSAFNDLVWFQYGTGTQGAGNLAVPAVYASGTSFTIAGVDVTTTYHANRRVRAVGSSTGTIYGTISSSSFSTNTTVNVTWDSGSLSNETLTVSLSQIPVTGKPVNYASVTGTFTPPVPFTVTGGALTLTGAISAPAWTTSGVRYKNAAATLTDTSSSGTVATAYTDVWPANTIAASSSTTYTNYFGSYFAAPTNGTNVTITNAWALGADSVKFGTSNQFSIGTGGHVTAEGVTSTGATGTGKFVFDGSPTLTTPTLGAATATTINGVSITGSGTLATGSGNTLTLTGSPSISGVTITGSGTLALGAKTLTVSNTLTFAGTDSTTMTFPGASSNIGYLELPINANGSAYGSSYTCVLADSGKQMNFAGVGITATIPANASVAYPVGTTLTFIMYDGTHSMNIAINSDTMYLANTAGTTGTRTLATCGIATAIKVDSTHWIISGNGLT